MTDVWAPIQSEPNSQSSLPPPPPGPAPSRRNQRAIAGAVGGLLLALLVALLFWLLRDDPGPSVQDPTDTPGTEQPAPATEPPVTEPPTATQPLGTNELPTPTDPPPLGTNELPADPDPEAPTGTLEAPSNAADAEFEATIDELIEIVEEIRGLEFKTRPVVVAQSEADFLDGYNTLVREDFEENEQDYTDATGYFHALGLLPTSATFLEASEALASGGIVGYYNTETDDLFVRGTELSPFVKLVVVHELVHALDDQWFELYRPEYEDREDEISFGFGAVIEGNARWVEEQYRRGLPTDEQAAIAVEELSAGGDFDFSTVTIEYLQLIISRYDYGELLIDELRDSGGQEAVDAAFVDPPDTSEKVMVFGAFTNDEDRIEVAPPPAEGDVILEGVLGQITLEIILGSVIDRNTAAEAAAGWGGDWFVTWADGDRTCLRADFASDSASDADELESALERWADRQSDASVASIDGGLLRLTSCA